MQEEFEVAVYSGAMVGYDVVYSSLDLMDCYDYVQKWCQNQCWEIHGPDFHDKSTYSTDDVDYGHALKKYS